jgi:hypothetical protein
MTLKRVARLSMKYPLQVEDGSDGRSRSLLQSLHLWKCKSRSPCWTCKVGDGCPVAALNKIYHDFPQEQCWVILCYLPKQSHCLYTFVMLSKIRLRCSACLIYCFLDLASKNETKKDETPEFPQINKLL